MNKSWKSDLVKDYIIRFAGELQSRKLSKSGLAKIIINENPESFTIDDFQNLRYFVRTYTGTGDKTTKPVMQLNNANHISELIKLPDSITKSRKVFDLPDGKYLILSDIHLPYHDKEAIEAAIAEGIKEGVTGVYLNGDTMDMFMVSTFTKFEKSSDIGEEAKVTRKFLEYLRSTFPNAEMYYKIGNHEARWERYIWSNAPQLAALADEELGESLGLAQLLQLQNFGVTYVGDRNIAYAGKLAILHGHEFGKSIFSPVNPARGAFLRAKSSVLIGHHHQTSVHHEGNLAGEKIACFSTGCLCDLSPNYRPFAYTQWNHGAAIVEVKGEDFKVDNFRIESGKRY